MLNFDEHVVDVTQSITLDFADDSIKLKAFTLFSPSVALVTALRFKTLGKISVDTCTLAILTLHRSSLTSSEPVMCIVISFGSVELQEH